jgi:hypothetical protein
MPVEIFCCYARKDQQLLQHLMAHLMPLQRQGLITMWSDTDINAGKKWELEITKHLNTSQIILLLVSPDFMMSQYIYSKEMKRAIERHEQGEATVIPIILRWVSWQRTPLGELQALPKDGKPVKSWKDEDEAFLDVAEGISKVIEEFTIKPPPPLPNQKTSESSSDDLEEGVQKQEKRPDSQAFWELKIYYPWLGDQHLDFLQSYHTWKQLAEAYRPTLMTMLEGIPRSPGTPDLTVKQADAILAFASEKARIQEEETT